MTTSSESAAATLPRDPRMTMTLGSSNPCDFSQDSVQVEIEAPYQPMTPLLRLTGTWNMKGSSSAQIQ